MLSEVREGGEFYLLKEEQTFKDQHWPSAAKNGEGLASRQAKSSSSHCVPRKLSGHPLEANNGPCQHRYPSSLQGLLSPTHRH